MIDEHCGDDQHSSLPLFVLGNSIESQEEEHAYIVARTIEEKSALALFLNASKVIERTIAETNVLYICPEEPWKRQRDQYLLSTGNFILIRDLASSETQQILAAMSDRVVNKLHQLLYRYAITNEQYEEGEGEGVRVGEGEFQRN